MAIAPRAGLGRAARCASAAMVPGHSVICHCANLIAVPDQGIARSSSPWAKVFLKTQIARIIARMNYAVIVDEAN